MKRLAIELLRILLSVFYAVCKWFPSRRKVVMLSREFDEEPLDFALLREELKRRDPSISVVTLCKTVPKGVAAVGYMFYMLYSLAQLATASVCVVDTYCLPVSLLNHKKSLTVIQIWHALGAIKQFGYQAIGRTEGRDRNTAEWLRMHRGYTKVLCPSQATAAFYKEAFDIADEQMLIGGMPRIDFLLSDQTALRDKILAENTDLRDKTVVLYAPTFRKGKATPYQDVANALDHDHFRLIVSIHPLDEARVDERYTVSGYSSTELLAIADVVITDYSSIAFEVALQQKALLFYLYDLEEYRDQNRGLNIDPTKEMPNCTATNVAGLATLLNVPYDYEALKAFCNRYIETADTHNTERLAAFVENSLVR